MKTWLFSSSLTVEVQSLTVELQKKLAPSGLSY